MKTQSSSALCAAVICGTFASFSAAHAIDFEYIKIIHTGDPVPGGTFERLFDFDVEGGQIVFTGAVPERQVFKFAGGTLTTVATGATAVPGGTGNFQAYTNVSISGGEVAFRALTSVDPSIPGIYATRNGSLTRIADTTSTFPEASDFYFGARQAGADEVRLGTNSAFSAGNAVFGMTTSVGGATLFLAKDDGSMKALSGPGLPVGFGGTGSIDGDQVAFAGVQDGVRGIFRYSISGDAVTALLPPGTVFPNGAVPARLEVPAISGSAVAFNVETDPGELRGIYIADDDGVRLVADGSTPAPGSTGTFTTGFGGLGLRGVTISNGNVAFLAASTAGGNGVYTTLGGSLSKVISTGDTIAGRAVAGPLLQAAPPKIDGGNILFGVRFTDGTSGLYVTASEHHWAATGGGAWDTAGNWSFGLAPRHVIPTFIDPENGGIITGPAGTTALKSLTIGASASGIAEFRMQAGGQINVAGGVTITPRGRLESTGVLSTGEAVDNSGVIAVTGTGQISGQLINRETGEVRVGAGQRLTIAAPASSNAGDISVIGGELEFTGSLTNAPATGIITARDTTLRFGQLTNAGALAIVAGTSDIYGDITNTGSIAVSGGAAGGSQTAIFHDDVVQNGTLTVSASGATRSVAVFLGGFSGAGGITGGGDVFFEGDLRPGNSPASVTYTANVSMAANATLTMELGGRVQGTQYDHLTVNGDLTLGGTLAVVLLGGFAPEWGDTFDLFDFDPARLSGTFASISLPTLAGDLSWDTSQVTDTGALTVVPEPGSAILLLFGASALLLRTRREARGRGGITRV